MNGRAKRPHPHVRPPPPGGVADAGEDGPGGGYLYRPDVLLTTSSSRAQVLALLDEHDGVGVREVTGLAPLDVTRIRVGLEGVDLPAVVDELRSRGGTGLEVAPDHVLGRTSHPSMIGVGRPRPAEPRAPLYEEPGLPGEGVRVGVLDTGAITHPFFAGRCVMRHPDDVDEADADEDGELDFVAGHGTFVVGTILGHAPRSTVVARRLPTEHGGLRPHQEFLTDTTLALALVTDPGLRDLDVLTLAVGGYTHDQGGLLATAAALHDLRASNPDLVVVAGAGNEQTDEPFYPAASPDVVAVAALDAACRERACFSNYGPWVDASAPGVDVHSTFLHWDGPLATPPEDGDHAHDEGHAGHDACDLEGGRDLETFEGWALWHGTSFAAPRVAAAVAARISAGRSGRDAVADVLHGPGHHRLDGLGTVVNPRAYP